MGVAITGANSLGEQRLTHVRAAFDLTRFLIAALRAQRIGQQMSGAAERTLITAGQRESLAGARFRLMRIALHQTNSPHLDPQQGIAGLDAQRPIKRR